MFHMDFRHLKGRNVGLFSDSLIKITILVDRITHIFQILSINSNKMWNFAEILWSKHQKLNAKHYYPKMIFKIEKQF